MSDYWSADETRELIDLWPIRSAGQIAAELHRSRSAVASKAKRLHLNGMNKHLDVEPRKRRLKQVPPPLPPPLPPSDDSLAKRPCTILELEAGRCHWPLGNVLEVAVMFCGGSTAPGRPYCQDHCRIARNG